MSPHRSSLTTAALAVSASLLALALVGCAARAGEGSAPQPASTGGESTTAAAPSDGASGEGYAGGVAHSEMEPSAEAEQGETLDAVTAYDALRSVQQDYDALLDRGSSDCPQAERLVQRICYLAERVCGLEGVDGAAARRDPNDPNDADGQARCDEARARCSSSESRLQRACAAPR